MLGGLVGHGELGLHGFGLGARICWGPSVASHALHDHTGTYHNKLPRMSYTT